MGHKHFIEPKFISPSPPVILCRCRSGIYQSAATENDRWRGTDELRFDEVLMTHLVGLSGGPTAPEPSNRRDQQAKAGEGIRVCISAYGNLGCGGRTDHRVGISEMRLRLEHRRGYKASIGLAGHLRTSCSTRTASTVVSPSTSPSPPTPSTNADRHPDPPPPSSFSSYSSSSSCISVSAAVASAMPINTTHNPDTPRKPALAMRTGFLLVRIAIAPLPHTFAWPVTYEPIAQRLSNQCLGHQPTLAASTSIVHIALSRLFSARVTLNHMRIHDSGIDRSPDTSSTSSTPTMPSPTHIPSPNISTNNHTSSPSTPTTTNSTITITEADTDTADFSCPNLSPCNHLTRRPGGSLLGYMRIHENLKACAMAVSANHGPRSLECDGSSFTPGSLPVDALALPLGIQVVGMTAQSPPSSF
nr:unnamed protein product [Spirometra erinaceieuropaei]